MKRTSLKTIEMAATARAAGYLERCLKLGVKVVIDGKEFIEISDDDHARIAKEFPPKLPSKMQQAKNLAGAIGTAAKDAAGHVTGQAHGAFFRSQEDRQMNRTVCETSGPGGTNCEYWRPRDERCGMCGCNFAWKSAVESWDCPKFLWVYSRSDMVVAAWKRLQEPKVQAKLTGEQFAAAVKNVSEYAVKLGVKLEPETIVPRGTTTLK